MTVADFIANGNQWPDNPDEFCQASFPDNLAPNQTIEVVIGDDRLFDLLVCKAIAQASHSCATPPTCFGAAQTKQRLAMQAHGVTPLLARHCRVTRDKIARIRKVIGRIMPIFGRCKV